MSLNPILSLGIIFLSGFIVFRFITKLRIPSVTGNLLMGIIIGQEFLDLVSHQILSASSFISNIVLGLIAFSIGQNFSIESFKRIGKQVIYISVAEAVGAWLTVTFVFATILGKPLYVSILFGAIASATAPAATVMVIREYKAKGLFTNTLLGVVAIDDAWCLMIFSISLAIARALSAHAGGSVLLFEAALKGIVEIIGAFLLGMASAWVFSKFARFIRTPTELQVYTLGFIFLTVGLAINFGLSILLSAMALGTTIVNISRMRDKFFNTLNNIEAPLYLLFFILAGANLEVSALKSIGLIGLTYLFFRVLGKVVGAYIGATLGKAAPKIRKYIGFALVPQAGVALGVALVAKSDFPEVGRIIFNTIITTTVIYELVGPMFTRFALLKAGEITLKQGSHE
ncbi:MAG: cation:proton antiporter [Candidatus Hydrothermota bacterium]|nr:MAG: cation:proton antiporter [Candidatus Hydrothermae bacterium]